MPRFLVDEDLSRHLTRELRAAGLASDDVRDLGLRGCSDDDIFRYAAAHECAIVTRDLGFARRRRQGRSHPGIVIVRFPNDIPSRTVNERVVRAVGLAAQSSLVDTIVVIEPGRMRIRRPD